MDSAQLPAVHMTYIAIVAAWWSTERIIALWEAHRKLHKQAAVIRHLLLLFIKT